MPLTTIDETPALVVVDLQIGIVAMPAPQIPEVVANSARLADAFRARGWPVVLINVEAAPGGRSDQNPTGGARILSPDTLSITPELGEGDVLITKHTRGAFHETELEAWLAERGVTQIFLTGIATGSGVEETGREGFARGLNIVTVTDAMTDSDPEIHDFCVRKVFPKWSETATTDELLAAL